MRLWITKESGTQPSQKVPGGEQGRYSYWDPEMWEKAQTDEPRKLLVVAFERIRETLMGGSKEGEGKPGNNGDSGKNDKR